MWRISLKFSRQLCHSSARRYLQPQSPDWQKGMTTSRAVTSIKWDGTYENSPQCVSPRGQSLTAKPDEGGELTLTPNSHGLACYRCTGHWVRPGRRANDPHNQPEAMRFLKSASSPSLRAAGFRIATYLASQGQLNHLSCAGRGPVRERELGFEARKTGCGGRSGGGAGSMQRSQGTALQRPGWRRGFGAARSWSVPGGFQQTSCDYRLRGGCNQELYQPTALYVEGSVPSLAVASRRGAQNLTGLHPLLARQHWGHWWDHRKSQTSSKPTKRHHFRM